MKLLLALPAIALLGVGVTACGNASKSTGSASQASSYSAATRGTPATTASGTTPAGAYAKADQDKDDDVGAPNDDTNNNSVLDYGHAANASDARAVTALVKRYYLAAVTGGGAEACSMIVSSLAKAVPEDYGQAPGPSYLRGAKTCPAVMSMLFKHSHSQLAAFVPTLRVTRVRLNGNHGLAVLSSRTMPERQIPVTRASNTWKVDTLLDSELP